MQALSLVVPVTDGVMATAVDMKLVMRNLERERYRWAALTPAQKAAEIQAAKDQRAAQRATAPTMPLTLDLLLTKLGWTTDYARHLVQTYCTCEPDSDDGWRCEHLEELDRD